jgi:hypothetical protein
MSQENAGDVRRRTTRKAGGGNEFGTREGIRNPYVAAKVDTSQMSAMRRKGCVTVVGDVFLMSDSRDVL